MPMASFVAFTIRDPSSSLCPEVLQPERQEKPMLPGRVIPFSSPARPLCPAPEGSSIVIQVGRDEELLRLRAMVIRSAGYTVHSILPEEAAAELQQSHRAQVWLFCHTLEFYELALLAAAIRRARPGDKFLRLKGLNDVCEAPGLFDELLGPSNGVDDLLRMVGDLAQP